MSNIQVRSEVLMKNKTHELNHKHSPSETDMFFVYLAIACLAYNTGIRHFIL